MSALAEALVAAQRRSLATLEKAYIDRRLNRLIAVGPYHADDGCPWCVWGCTSDLDHLKQLLSLGVSQYLAHVSTLVSGGSRMSMTARRYKSRIGRFYRRHSEVLPRG